MVIEPRSITKLRELQEQPPCAMSVEKLLHIVELLRCGALDRNGITAMCDVANSDLLDTIVGFGVWLGQSQKLDKPELVSWSDIGELKQERPGKASKRTPHRGQLTLFAQPPEGHVALPEGFDRRSCQRDLTRAMRSILSADIDAGVVTRWLLRRNHALYHALTYDIVAATHTMFRLGRGADIDQIAVRGRWANVRLARNIVAAYDLLEYARQDACAAIERLAAGTSESPRDDCVRARWLDEGHFTRMLSLLDRPGAGGQVTRLAQHSMRHMPADIGELTPGQVRRLVESAGISTETVTYQIEETVRDLIEQAGLSEDRDVLYADGLLVVAAGCRDEFEQALQRRADGRFDWADELNAALAQR